MNTENFKEFLENPSRLYQLSYQELKSLVLQYPYSANLHYLLLQKSLMEDHREQEQNRQKAAVYSFDRTYLFKLLRELTSADKKEPILQLDEEFLELKDLSFLEIETPSIPAVNDLLEDLPGAPPMIEFPFLDTHIPDQEEPEIRENEEEKSDITFDTLTTISSDQVREWAMYNENGVEEIHTPDEEESRQEETILEPPPPETPSFRYSAPDHVIHNAISISALVKQVQSATLPIAEKVAPAIESWPEAKKEESVNPSLYMQKQLLDKLNSLIGERAVQVSPVRKPVPQPKGNFTSWVQQFQPGHVRQQLSDIMETKKREELKRLKKKQRKDRKKKKKSNKEQRIVQFAEQSLTSHQTIVSETLAELLAEQGEIRKSIEMYERLKLFFPEKSTYFAAIIEKLKTK